MTKNKGGRPKKAFDWDKLDAILQYGAWCVDCADILDVSKDTVERRIKEKHGLTFDEYRHMKMSRTRMRLAQKQIEAALAGNVTMLIWLGKQYLGQQDKHEVASTAQIKIDIDKDDQGV